MRQPKISKRLTKSKADQAMDMLLSGEKTLPQIAQELNVPLRAIAAWATEPMTLQRAFCFSLLNDARIAAVVGAVRTSATMRLFALTNDAKEKDELETARKACVDLLKLDFAARPQQLFEDERGVSPPQPRPMRMEDVMHSFQNLSGLNTQKEAYRP